MVADRLFQNEDSSYFLRWFLDVIHVYSAGTAAHFGIVCPFGLYGARSVIQLPLFVLDVATSKWAEFDGIVYSRS